jgi:hypothetical protein
VEGAIAAKGEDGRERVTRKNRMVPCSNRYVKCIVCDLRQLQKSSRMFCISLTYDQKGDDRGGWVGDRKEAGGGGGGMSHRRGE